MKHRTAPPTGPPLTTSWGQVQVVSRRRRSLLTWSLATLVPKHVDGSSFLLSPNEMLDTARSELAGLLLPFAERLGPHVPPTTGGNLPVAPSQPFHLSVLRTYLAAINDPDFDILTRETGLFATGVRVGAGCRLLRTPAVFERKLKWRNLDDTPIVPGCHQAEAGTVRGGAYHGHVFQRHLGRRPAVLPRRLPQAGVARGYRRRRQYLSRPPGWDARRVCQRRYSAA